MEKDEAPASASPRDEKNPTPDGDGNPVTRLFKDVGTKVRNVVAFVERVETEVLDDKTVDDKVKALQHTRNVKTLRQMWIDLILSKEFTTIIDQVFDRCCNLNDDDDDDDGTDGEGKLDRTELGAAMKMLWERLDQKTGGGRKLPRIKESEETVLRRYDADSDGHLDRDEFHGFAKTYFSRMEWPAWKVAAKGATKGLAFYLAQRVLLQPTIGVVKAMVGPIVKAKIQRALESGAADALRGSLRKVKYAVKRPLAATKAKEGKAMLEEELSEMRARRRTALFEFVKSVGICAVGGGVGAVAGWL
ncbi:hypothetical protein N9M16_02260 [Candidatus Dependentiae bacterium]|nr:hypothetical protein [Candidatus Dependentiae bacterium]